MKTLLLLLCLSTVAKAAPLVQPQDVVSPVQVLSSTLTANSQFLNQWNTVAISSAVNVSAVFFYGFVTTTTYSIQCYGVKHTAGNLQWQSSGDTGSNYNFYAAAGQGTNGWTTTSGAAVAQGQFGGGGAAMADGGIFTLTLDDIHTWWGSKSKLFLHGKEEYLYLGNNQEIDVVGGSYFGANQFASLKIMNSAGTFDISCTVKQFYTTLNN